MLPSEILPKTKFTHAAEQWTASIGDDRANPSHSIWVVDGPSGSICDLTCPANEMMKRAFLIAAAPNLYEALQAVVNYEASPDFTKWKGVVDRAKAALLKARGETSLAQAEGQSHEAK